ncbi:Uncharacterised protein [Mycobacteroides abscessus subsp. abscessus]|nr:Uncharacterised protein [Mycobacteroides abscessus subsp. abscessus]
MPSHAHGRLDIPHARLGGLQLPGRHRALTLTALEHLVVAVVAGQDLRAHILVVGDRGEHCLRRRVDQHRTGRTDLTHEFSLATTWFYYWL